MGHEGETMSVGMALELAVRWALPASPLFLAILMLLAHAPYAAPLVVPAWFYLACTAGALVGLVACALPCRTTPVGTQAACVAGGVALEAAWLVLLAAEKSACAPLLLDGAAAGGLASAVLLVGWLWVGQTDSLLCEMTKLACAFGFAYVLYTLFSVIPHAGVVSYLFPVLTCVPLCLAARTQAAEGTGVGPLELPEGSPRPSAWRIAVTGALIGSFGAGFAALGFGGELVEQGAGLLALLLAICLLVRPGDVELLHISAMPLVASSLCYEALAGHGNAFAFFLAGCGSLVIWLFLQHRFGYGKPLFTTVRAISVRILFIAACAGAGMLAGHVAFEALDVAPDSRLFSLVALIVVLDYAWRATTLPRPRPVTVARAGAHASGCPGGPADVAPGTDDGLYARLALSPREVQVADMLRESRSVSYISQALGMAPSTTKTHVRHVYEKAGVHSRSEFQLFVERVGGGGDGA